MRRMLISLLLILAAAGAALAQAPSSSLKLPPYKKVKLKNGMTLLLVERHTVPLIGFHAIVKAGAVADASGKDGTSSMTANLLRKGTKTRTADQFTNELDFIGGQFDAGSSADNTTVSAQFVKKDIAKGLDLFADALMNPIFPQDEFTKLQKQRLDGLKSAKDQAQAVIGNYFNAYFYGSHPYARPSNGDEKSMAALTRDDVVKFYQSFYAPGNIILAVAGDFNTPEMEKLLAQKFEMWPARQAPSVALPSTTGFTGKKLLLIDKPDSTQTYFRIGNLGVARTNADRVYLRVVNTLFGGRFTSMINTELRIKTGLTYGASAFFDERKVPGAFEIATYTKNATTVEAIDKTLDVLKQLHEKGVTEEQLTSAKKYIQGQFPPSLETAGQLAGVLADLEFYGLDEHEINDLYAKINAMTLADAQRVIKQYYPMDNLVFVLIGKSSEIGDAVKKYAPKVDTLKISDPGYGNK
ncbi:MAG: insulinase family protein [Acidobacteriia bacterium]|nr:insulinase family protein [Terriglobia bacterium]